MLKQNNLSDILCLRTTKGKGGKEILTMSQINDIRDLSQKGYSISKISSLTGLDRKTIRKYLNQDDFSPQPPVAKRRTSIVTPYLDIIVFAGDRHWMFFYAVSRTCFCRYLSECSDNIRFSCMLTFWAYLMRCTYP